MGFRLAHPAHWPVRTLIARRAEVIAVSEQNAAIEEKGAVLAVVPVFYKGRGLARIKLASFPQMGPSLSPKWTNQTSCWAGGDKPLLWFPPDMTPSKSICTVHNRYTQPWFSHHLRKPWDPTATEQSGVYPHGSVLTCKYSSEEKKKIQYHKWFEKWKRDVSLNINPSYKLFRTLQTRSLTSMVISSDLMAMNYTNRGTNTKWDRKECLPNLSSSLS